LHSEPPAPPQNAPRGRDATRRPLLDFYFFRVVLMRTLGVGLVVFLALSLERVLRLTRVLTAEGSSATEAWGLIVLLIPHYLGLAIPAGFFVGSMLGSRLLYERSELTVLRSFGFPARRLLRPLWTLAGLLALMMAVLVVWVQSHARFLFRDHLNAILTRDSLGGLEAGAFHRVGEEAVLRVQKMSPDKVRFEGFFLAHSPGEGQRDILTSSRARRERPESDPDSRDLHFILEEGALIREIEVDGRNSLHRYVEFQEMPVRLAIESLVQEPGPRGSAVRELTMAELLGGREASVGSALPATEIRAELHARILRILVLPVLGALALPMALMGQGRSARAAGLVVGPGLLLLFEKTAHFGEVMAETGQVSPWVGIWLPFLGLAVLTVLAYRWFSADFDFPEPKRRRVPLPICSTATLVGR